MSPKQEWKARRNKRLAEHCVRMAQLKPVVAHKATDKGKPTGKAKTIASKLQGEARQARPSARAWQYRPAVSWHGKV